MRTVSPDRTGRRIVAPTPRPPAGCIGDPISSPYGLTLTTPAGSLTSGTPQAQYAAGRYEFRSSIMVLGVQPTLDTGGFLARFQSALSALVPGVRAVSAALTRGSETTARVPRINNNAIPGSSVLNAVLPDRDVQAWWISVEGTIDAAQTFAVNGSQGVNRAIARAVAQSVAFRGFVDDDFRSVIPTDGGPLDAQFRAGNACSGGYNPRAVYARACTRFQAAGPNALQPAAPTATTTPGPNALQPATPAAPSCAIRLAEKMFLRPTATFATRDAQGRPFREIPPGTAITVTGPKIQQQGTLALYPVSVAGAPGYGALSARDFVGCTEFAAPGASSSSGGSRPSSSSTSSSSTALAPRPAQTALSQAIFSQDSTGRTLAYAGAAAAAVVLLGGVALWYTRRSKRNGRKHRVRRARRSR